MPSTDSFSEQRRARRLWQIFSLTPGDYDRIVAFQDGACAICRKPPKEGSRLAVEHDHATGLIRGGVCWPCNRLLGMAGDRAEFLQAAARYLASPPATEALGAPRYGLPGRVGTKKQRKLWKKRQKEMKSPRDRILSPKQVNQEVELLLKAAAPKKRPKKFLTK